MRYLFIHAMDPVRRVSPDEWATVQARLEQWLTENRASGNYCHGARLAGADSATTVRVRVGERLVTDGPFAETKEQIAGYDVIECEDLDQAIEIASRHPTLLAGAIEIRPFWGD